MTFSNENNEKFDDYRIKYALISILISQKFLINQSWLNGLSHDQF